MTQPTPQPGQYPPAAPAPAAARRVPASAPSSRRSPASSPAIIRDEVELNKVKLRHLRVQER